MPIATPPEWMPTYADDDDHFLHVLDHLFAPATRQAEYELLRPSSAGADLIHAEIIRKLETADLVLCDMSTLNANVFFELGIRTSLDRSICLVCDDATAQLPFDTGIINTHRYKSALTPWELEAEVASLESHIKASTKQLHGQNPIWKYFGLTQPGKPAADAVGDDPHGEKLDLILKELNQGIRQAASRPGLSPQRRDTTTPAYIYSSLNWVPDEIARLLSEATTGDDNVHVVRYARTPDGKLVANFLVERNGRRGIVEPLSSGMELSARKAGLLQEAFHADEAMVVAPNLDDRTPVPVGSQSVTVAALGDLVDIIRSGWPLPAGPEPNNGPP
jgi:hypothetical protein